MDAFPAILEKIPNARLIVAGGNHSAAPGYWESVRTSVPAHLPIEFLGYVPQKDVANLFRTSSLLVMPYESSTGSSGPAHQACEYGLPIVCADIADFHCMAIDDDMAILFYKLGDTADLAEKVSTVLESPELQLHMSEHNYEAGVQMTMSERRAHLFSLRCGSELHRLEHARLVAEGLVERIRRRLRNSRNRNDGNCPTDEDRNEQLISKTDSLPDHVSSRHPEIITPAHTPVSLKTSLSPIENSFRKSNTMVKSSIARTELLDACTYRWWIKFARKTHRRSRMRS